VPARRRNILFRFAQILEARGKKHEHIRPDDREMGQVKAEAGGDIQEAIHMSLALHGRRGAGGPVRPDDAVRSSLTKVHDERPHAGRRRRRDHAVRGNFRSRSPGLEDHAGACLQGNTRRLEPAEGQTEAASNTE